MTMPSTELKTKAELELKYNPETDMGKRCIMGVHILEQGEYYVGNQGEIRWNSSDNIVPGDILELAVVQGTIDIESRNKSEEVREVEDAIFFEQYRQMRAKVGYSDEEKFEMRAAFGDDEDIIDIITGERVIL